MAQRRNNDDREDAIWLRQLDPARVPRHVAMIMDGNGRWAKRRRLPRQVGHAQGAQTVDRVVRACRHLPERWAAATGRDEAECGRVEYLTLYTFSNENWNRPREEVTGLMSLIERQLREKLADMQDFGVAIKILGRQENLPTSLIEELNRDMAATAGNQEMTLYLALNYGGRCEIVDAARQLAEAVGRGELRPDQIDEAAFAARLYAPGVPDPELMIRTGGELRVSNFLLWQIAYAELWVTATLWPALQAAEVYQAMVEYQSRERRFGGLVANGKS